MIDHNDNKAHRPQFEWSFLHPKYWGTWLAVIVGALLSLLPHGVRRAIAIPFAKLALKIKGGATHRARINLLLCFPEKSHQEREQILLDTFITAGSYLMGLAGLTTRSRQWMENNSVIHNMDNLTKHTDAGESVILLVPHTWAVDIPAVLLASRGLPISSMAKKQSNPVADWLMNRQRLQYGGKIYERSVGIKPFIKSIRDGYLGYYLPDEDLGPNHSVFVDFFATTKATISGLGKLSKLSRAKIVPLFSTYNNETGKFDMHILPALDPFPSGSEEQDARMMNEQIELFVSQQPEQYMWILKLLKTQRPGIVEPYCSDEYKF
ncbi:lauroyl acyltransferase [Photobacterium jeanii]|uniref:Lipid A biosynthesis acyltransferase n=1 Tax=Photobacterium jeanii TaxID=858640 RepID=A0A178KIE6_9GAMM|nr:lauroyl-Kdo(2)-lipid IV(A) myristoyltransferase [Photobacterium jeanii]OAN17011.1 lauroyl acyltransferase [Photobacterium jeanii]PST88301.1 lauroyl-Kdo(2)-lipid IV(A) myristoyltransferase [Photobacterium jeanii]